MATDKIKRALRPALPMATPAAYEAAIAGVGNNTEYQYTDQSGISPTLKENANRNVFSTFALLQGNTVATEELVKDRIKNADSYAAEAQEIARTINKRLPVAFEKSSYLGTIVDMFPWLTEGVTDFGAGLVRDVGNLPDTWKDLRANQDLDWLWGDLRQDERENVNYALEKAYGLLRYGPAAKEVSMEDTYSQLARYHSDLMTKKDGRPLSERERHVIEAFQKTLLTKEQNERNRMEDAFFSEYEKRQFANAWVNPGMGATGWRTVGNIAGQALASGYMFRAIGMGPQLFGLRTAVKGVKTGRGLVYSGIKDLRRAQTIRAGLSRWQATGRLIDPKIATRVAALDRYANYQIGVGKFVANNFGKMAALGALTGKAGVFSQSFLQAFTDTRNELLANGASWGVATGAAIASGFAEASLETLIGFRFLNKFLTQNKSFTNFLMKAVIPEGVEELSQTAATEAIKTAVGFNDKQFSDIAAEMLYSFLGGAMGGAFFGAGSYAAISNNDRVMAAMDYEYYLKNNKKVPIDSTLEAYGKKQADIRARYTEESRKLSEQYRKERLATRKAIRDAAKTGMGIDPNWETNAEITFGQKEKELQAKHNKEEQALQEKMANELQQLRQQHQQLQGNLVDQSKSAFTQIELDILDKLRAEYEERAKKVNPNVTLDQLDKGWNAVKQMLLHDGYTGEFTTAVSNAMDNMISFAQASNKQIKDGLDNLAKTMGLDETYKSDAAKLTSADNIERYNAQLDEMEKAVTRDFMTAGASQAEASLLASIFRNQIGHLPAFALSPQGTEMTPLEFYNAVKPRIINVQNSLMHNEHVDNLNNVMMEATNQSDSEENYVDANGNIDYEQAYEKYLNLWNLIESYELADESGKKELLANINLQLFNSYNYTDDIEFIKQYIEGRAAREYAIVKDMGLDYGSSVTDEDYRVLALMRQKGLSFAFSARAIGLVQDFTQDGKSEEELNAAYEAKLNELYPPMSAEDRAWLNRIAKMEGVGKKPKYRDYTVNFADNNRTVYKESAEQTDESAEQAKQDIAEEEGQLAEETVDAEQVMQEVENAPAAGDTVTITKAEQENMDVAHERETGQTSKFIAPNALYSRKGKTILVLNGQNQGEFLHEGGHYFITELVLGNIELSYMVGDRAFGPINQLIVDLYGALKGNKNIRLNPVAKQETILDALVDFVRNDGKTGDAKVDAIISQLQSELNRQILHIADSRYSELNVAQKENLRNAIKNLLKPTAGMELLNRVKELDDLMNNSPIEDARKAAIDLLNNYAIPNSDMFMEKLVNGGLDYISARGLLEEIKNEANLQAISLLLNNTDSLQRRAEKESRSKNPNEDIQDDQVFFMAAAEKTTAENKAPVKLAREELSWRERGEQSYEASKDLRKNAGKYISKYTRPFFASLIDVANRLSPNLGPVIQHAMYDHDQLVREGQHYGKMFIDALKEQNKTNNPITQEDYDKNFVDPLNNMMIDDAKAWIVSRASTPEIAAKFNESFNGMISFLNTAKSMMKALEVNANWMADGEFFPRSIKDYQKFSEEWLKMAPEGIFAKMVDLKYIDEKDAKVKKEQANYVLQRAFAKLIRDGNNAEGRVGFLQNRVITEVTPEMRQYYKDPIDAYMDYVSDAATTILTRQLIGASHDQIDIDENGNMNSILNAGQIYTVLKNEGLLQPGRKDLTGMTEEQIQEVREQEERVKEFNKALGSFINRKKEYNTLYKYTNDILTTTMLAHASTALSQGQEMITTAWLFGLANTATAAKDVLRGKAKLTIQDLGIDELEDAYKALTTGTMEKIASGALKLSGFKLADVYFKNVAINAIYNYFSNALSDPNSSDFAQAKELIEKSFSGLPNYEERVVALMENLKNKKVTDDIKYLMYDVFANQQPINAANIAYGYNAASPLGRLCLYKFNTVAYKQAHAIVSRLKENFTAKGPDGKLKMRWEKAMLEVVKFLLFCGMIGVPLETAKSLLNLKAEFDPKKDFIFSVGQCFMLNEYDAKVLAKEGFGSLIQNKMAAPLTPLNWITQDVMDLWKGKYTAKTLKGGPVFGRPLQSIVYAIANSNNDGIGFDFDYFGENTFDDFMWG